uniref:Uncharacterized protein n=1 Tax=Pundamilia nyererei TaxID=303518 RepID=A0A3B4F2Y0_9CICH
MPHEYHSYSQDCCTFVLPVLLDPFRCSKLYFQVKSRCQARSYSPLCSGAELTHGSVSSHSPGLSWQNAKAAQAVTLLREYLQFQA